MSSEFFHDSSMACRAVETWNATTVGTFHDGANSNASSRGTFRTKKSLKRCQSLSVRRCRLETETGSVSSLPCRSRPEHTVDESNQMGLLVLSAVDVGDDAHEVIHLDHVQAPLQMES